METQSTKEHKTHSKKHIDFGIITVSTSRNAKGGRDTSGDNLAHSIENHHYCVAKRTIVPDNKNQIKNKVLEYLDAVDIIITTGGTGIAKTDITVEAVRPLFDKELESFNTIFMIKSHESIGTASMLSRACAGIIKGKVVFCLPGSPDACALAIEKIILKEAGHILKHAGE
ncbi:MAG: molybdenum cofactor biosynthesis protein [Candidatus Nanohalarchaeota archaeon]|nr:MAG: molybdenum cofactor biosynthesis protein [Candidatus Nanohaloarchaeota archaeon]